MTERISSITGIPEYHLTHFEPEHGFPPVAQRMSWAASRRTTRSEDEAYCLLGIFGINMALLYGEGSKAFLRLQQEIIGTTSDQSVFAWRDSSSLSKDIKCGLLARAPRYFKGSKHVSRTQMATRRPYAMTNLGIEMSTKLIEVFGSGRTVFIMRLNCLRTEELGPNRTSDRPVEIALVYQDEQQGREFDEYAPLCRTFTDDLGEKLEALDRRLVRDKKIYLVV